MKRVICLLLCLLMLTGGVPAAAPDANPAPGWLLADGDTGDSDSGDSGDSDAGDSDTGDSGDSDVGDSGDSGDSDTGDSGDSDGGDSEPEIVRLTAPEKVGWGRDYHFLLESYRKQKSEQILKDENGVEYVACPGMIYWSVSGVNQKKYRIDIYYREPEAEPVLVETVEEWTVANDRTMESNFRFFWDNHVSGDYYFTVRAVGDGLSYADSETIISGDWTYEAPEGQLSRPSRPRWKNVSEAATVAIYAPTQADDDANGNLDSSYRVGYEARWWYSKALTNDDIEDEDDAGNSNANSGASDSGDSGASDSGDSNADSGASDSGNSNADSGASDSGNSNADSGDSGDSGSGGSGTVPTTKYDPTKPVDAGTILTFYPKHFEFKPSEKMLADFGTGYYSVQIRALSADMTTAKPSEWSELSMARHIVAENDDLTTIVERVDANTDALNRQIAINNVRKFGTYRLLELMAADKDNTGAAAAIAQLEEVTGNETEIVVSGGVSDLFPEDKITVIGAGLNVDLGQSVVFHLGVAHADEVPSTLYSNAVRFSMQLLDTNGASLTSGGTELRVPAKITLPVPETINPTFFVILHHRMDGVVETIPNVSLQKVKNQWYATFVVTNFSDFTMAEQNAFLQASAYAGGVSVSYRFRTGDVKTAFCAVRDKSGRPCATAALELSETTKTVQIPCADPASVKLFLLDADRKPVFPAIETPVT